MEDKEEITIDGVNVLECEHYEYKSIKDCEMRYPESGDCEIRLLNYLFNGNLDIEKLCIDNPDCHFKQLKRKEKECEELKAQNKQIKQEQADKINSAYKQANDEIYQYIKTCICELCTQQDDCNGCYLKDFLNFIDNAKEQN